MTQYWTNNDGTLEVWTHIDDPSTDPPVNSTTAWSGTWVLDGHPEKAERLLEQWIKDQAILNDIGYQDVTRTLVDLRAGELEQV